MSSDTVPAPLGVPAPDDGRAYLVPFDVGDGRDAILLTVSRHAEFLRGLDGTCAFCHGDPCAELSGPETLIGNFFQRNSRAAACPLCDGRPT